MQRNTLVKSILSKVLALFVLLIFIPISPIKSISRNAEYSLITCAAGNDVYSLFGHTAIRVKDIHTNEDLVFNYGIFDFNSDHFIWKFVKGETYYKLGVYPFESFVNSYKIEKRSIWEQKLDLDSLQKAKMLGLLLRDYQPQNRTYLYNFLYNNCATKVRDHLEIVLQKDTYNKETSALTFRQILTPYIHKASWIELGINLALGKPLDQNITPREKLFLPYELMEALQNKGYHPTNIYLAEPTAPQTSFATPTIVFIFFHIIVFFLALRQKRIQLKILILIYLLVLGLAGVILFTISFFSIHPMVNPNFHILFFQPLLILLVPWFHKFSHHRNSYLFLAIYFIGAMLAGLISGQQTRLPIVLFESLVCITLLVQWSRVKPFNRRKTSSV